SPVPSTEAFYESLRQSATARVMLPDGEEDLERAGIRFLQRLKPDEWIQLDKDLHEQVLVPRGGLNGSLMTSGDLSRTLTEPLLDRAITLLGQYLAIMDFAQMLASEIGLVASVRSFNGAHEPHGLGAQLPLYHD